MTIDRSDYLPALFGKPAEFDDLYARDLTDAAERDGNFDLLSDAAHDSCVIGAGKAALDNSDKVRELMPKAQWYRLDSLSDLEFIIEGDTVWITPTAANTRSLKVAKSDALAVIYAAHSAGERAYYDRAAPC